MIKLRFAIPLLLAVAVMLFLGQTGKALQVSNNDMTVSMSQAGVYSVSSTVTGWTFSGSLPNPPLTLVTTAGTDSIGSYQQLSFSWLDSSSRQMSGTINLYASEDLLLFSDTLQAASGTPPSPFPNFTTIPSNLNPYSYHNDQFGPPIYSLESGASSPWVFFDSSANTMIISPASHFIPAAMFGDGKTQIASGFNSQVTSVPAGLAQQTMLAMGAGINKTFAVWGQGLTSLYNKTRPANDADTLLRYYGYWTDNGATYYYNPGTASQYEPTLESVQSSFNQAGIPLHYMQLDSWWYDKTDINYNGQPISGESTTPSYTNFGGLYTWQGDTSIFPSGVGAFSGALGNLPFVCHSRWIDLNSAYHQNPSYTFAGLAATNQAYWADRASYAKANNIMFYEQDWLHEIITYSGSTTSNATPLLSTVDQGDDFLDNMASAFAAQGIDIQYCIPTPACYMQASKYSNVTNSRCSFDRFSSNQYHTFQFDSRLVSAVGVWPFSDVFYTGETQNLLLANLSAGPVGTGDAIGSENATSLFRAIRGDGVIVKPDTAMVPTDGSYLAEAANRGTPYVSTATTNNGVTTTYATVIAEPNSSTTTFTLSPADLGVTSPAYYYDYFAGSATLVQPTSTLTGTVSSGGVSYFIIAPVGQSGIAFLGDYGKFVSNGKKRIKTLVDKYGQLTADVLFAPNESQITLVGYSNAQPTVTAQGGTTAGGYNPSTQRFAVSVSVNNSTPLNSDIDPAREVLVTFNTQPIVTVAASQLTHGNAGAFSLPLVLTGTPTIEPRVGSPVGNYSIVVNFSLPVSSLAANLGLQAGQSGTVVGTAQSPVISGSTATINLTNVGDAQRLVLHLTGIQPGNSSADIPINILWGDANQDGTVSTQDFLLERSNSQNAITNSNFLYDTNADGTINVQDVLLTRSYLQTFLP